MVKEDFKKEYSFMTVWEYEGISVRLEDYFRCYLYEAMESILSKYGVSKHIINFVSSDKEIVAGFRVTSSSLEMVEIIAEQIFDNISQICYYNPYLRKLKLTDIGQFTLV